MDTCGMVYAGKHGALRGRPDVTIAYAAAQGATDGRAAGSWVIDGNTSPDAARAIVDGLAAGDPAVLDRLPYADLSGQWADTLTGPQLLADSLAAAGLDYADSPESALSDVCDAYETAFSQASADEIERSARAILP